MGVFVPVWGPGPCHNPRCDACVDERVGREERVDREERVQGVQGAMLAEPEPVESEPAPARSDDDD